MHKQRWIYFGNAKSHFIDLFHFANSNLVVIKLNGVTLYNEEIHLQEEQKSVSFFIDQELCEVTIKKAQQNYEYNFHYQPYSTSKIGQKRKLLDRLKEGGVALGLLFTLGFSLLLVGMIILQHHNALRKGGIMAEAVVLYIGANKQRAYNTDEGIITLTGNTHYRFLLDGKWYYGATKEQAERINTFTTNIGFPISEGNEFMVLFQDSHPNNNQILFHRPTQRQLQQYALLARSSCFSMLEIDTVRNHHLAYCDCLIQEIAQKHRLLGLAFMYLQAENQAFLHHLMAHHVRNIRHDLEREIKVNCLEAWQPPVEEDLEETPISN